MSFDMFTDERGYNGVLTELEPDCNQIHTTWSRAGVIRGMHFQAKNPNAKLVSCLHGVIQDFAVCIETGEMFVFGLIPGCSVYIPRGYAHGFASISDSVVMYQLDGPYDSDDQHGFHYDSGPVKDQWNVKTPIVSCRDQALPTWDEIKKEMEGR